MSKLPPPQAIRIGLLAARASQRYADQFAELRALAKVLQSAAELDKTDKTVSRDHGKVASIIARLSDEYSKFALADANMFEVSTEPEPEEGDFIPSYMPRPHPEVKPARRKKAEAATTASI
jgi:hypothetical protein